MERIFLDWGVPPLQLLRGYLHRFAESGEWDLRDRIVVLPTSAACQRLEALLVESAENENLQLSLPQIVTLGDFPELLYHPRYAFAGEQTQTLAWVRALQSLDADRLKLLSPHPPRAGHLEAWIDLADLLKRLHRELSSQMHDFPDVLQCLSNPDERLRWQVLVDVQHHYFHELDAIPLWDLQQARRIAIQQKELVTNQQLIVAFCVDLNSTQRALLNAVEAQVVVVVAAPNTLQRGFDTLGCLDHEFWCNCDLDVDTQQLHLAVSAEDQAARTVELLAKHGENLAIDAMAVAAADPALAPLIHERLRELESGLQWAAGTPAIRSAPAMLCEAIADCVERGGFGDWARLARHPHLSRLTGPTASDGKDWLEHFDEFYGQHLPVRLDLPSLDTLAERQIAASSASGKRKERTYFAALRAWYVLVADWLAPMLAVPKTRSEWREPLQAVLSRVYSEMLVDRPAMKSNVRKLANELEPSCLLLAQAIDRVTDVPNRLDGPVTASHVLHAVLEILQRQAIQSPVDEHSIAGIGWLETPLDDRALLVVTGFADGVVPQMVGVDPFIPSGLRKQLKLEDNERRHGRDAYALQLTLHSGRTVHFVVGRLDTEGRPVAPSRLLIARPAVEVPDRVLRLYQREGADFLIRDVVSRPTKPRDPTLSQPMGLNVAMPNPGLTVNKMSVTSFGDYLRCPYRFYLRHVLGLRSSSDAAEELDPRQFGNLIHDALEALGRDPLGSQSDEPAEIREFLHAEVDRLVGIHYGELLNATVAFQVEQAKARLAAVASQQAVRARAGWQIKFVELEVALGSVTVPGSTMPLIGRIDRVDYHSQKDLWAILDYKTGSKGKKPRAAHLQRGKWLSLQLPLYRHMVPEINPERCELGYFVIPPKVSETLIQCEQFTDQELKSADQESARIAEAVQRCEFWPPVEPYDGIDDYAAICQSRAQERSTETIRKGV